MLFIFARPSALARWRGRFGIQSLDLLGRKLWMQGDAPLRLLQSRIAATLAPKRVRVATPNWPTTRRRSRCAR
ncbi:hypothetical protein RM530_07585 [Algiphilus sp. W345]|uniref:Uncharacterized protein n=1 Tax=Banduia mediterranea TaxID=3075609 RepID=A0ABU2WH81_9GAMM|nr:hypothetical protein [Algiphilus sp. W345]MDT0497225.1 hypothetical protein [Algiphilus sp. W345]